MKRGRPARFDREAVLKLAMNTFWRFGYEGATVSLLTSDMGLNPPSFYAAFGSKEALFKEVIAHYLQRYGNYRQTVISQAADIRSGIEQLFHSFISVFASCEDRRGCLIVLGMLSGSPETRFIQQLLESVRHETTRMLHDEISAAVQRGELPAETDSLALATYFSTYLHGLSIQARDNIPRDQLESTISLVMSAWPTASNRSGQ